MKLQLLGLIALLMSPFVHAQNWKPAKPVTIIVPWAAGGSTDQVTRLTAAELEKHLGQKVVIVNQPGASGSIGTKSALEAPKDGHTWTAGAAQDLGVYRALGMLETNITDWHLFLSVANVPLVGVNPNTPYKTMKDLLDDAKKRPGQVTVGATLASTSHFFPALIEKASGVKFKYVSYEGLAPRMNAILGGHVDLTDSNLTQKGKVEAGQLRFLAIATEKRHPEMPSVPTLKELGVNVVFDVNRGIMAPKGTPADVIAKLGASCAAAAKEPEFAKAMSLQGTDVRYMDRAAYTRWLKEADELNRVIAKDLGLLKR